MITIMMMSGPDDGATITLAKAQGKPEGESGVVYFIGRREDSQIPILYDTQVSREHASLTIRNGRIWLSDLGSRNGSFVRGERIATPSEIAVGELFQIGHTWLRIEEITEE